MYLTISERNYPQKLAFLFLIYDSIHNEQLWYRFFEKVDPSKYSIYIHYKSNIPLKYFEKYKLTNCIPTEYCKPSIVQAKNLLIKEALTDLDNYKFDHIIVNDAGINDIKQTLQLLLPHANQTH